MPDDDANGAEFRPSLIAEVDRILEDPIFHRSPVLRKLLQYLRDKTVDTETQPVSQFSIAVDGLGRRADYDQDAESYARVQISRLRKSLGEYYTRNQPGEHLCVYLPHGNYQLRLATLEKAYPELRPTRLPGSGEGEPPADAKLNANPFARRSFFVVAATIVAVLLFLGLALNFGLKWFRHATIAGPANVSVQIVGVDDIQASDAERRRKEVAGTEIRKALSSAVIGVESDNSDAAYRLTVDLGAASQPNSSATVRLTNSRNLTIFAQTAPIGENDASFIRSLDAVLTNIFSTSGVIANDLTDQFDIHQPRSAFECFISIEVERATGEMIKNTLLHCLSTFPRSSYAPYWYARLSFTEYQLGVMRGEPVRRDSGGWPNLVRALDSDRYNPFANALAAKVELAGGNCKQAQIYLARSISRSLTFPAMKAGLLIDTLPCARTAQQKANLQKAFDDLLVTQPDADPVVRVYLTLGALELGNAKLARSILAEGISKPRTQASVAKALNALEMALVPQPGRKLDTKELERWVACFAWNPMAQKSILHTLGIAADGR